MDILKEARNGILILHPIGPLDLYIRLEFLKAIQEVRDEGFQRIIVDLGQVRYVDSIMLSACTKSYRSLATEKIQFGLANPQEFVREIFNLVHLDSLVPVFSSVDEAVASYTERGRSHFFARLLRYFSD